MAIEKRQTDYEAIAEAYGIKVGSIKQAIKRRSQYPNNPVLKAVDEFRKGKSKLAMKATMKATKNKK